MGDRGRRAERSCNIIITRVEHARLKRIHKKKLRTIKANVDNSCPASYAKGRPRNLKREQLMEERFTEIERENRILLQKMSRIMQTNTIDTH